MIQTKVCPVSADAILRFLVRELFNKVFFREREGREIGRLAEEAESVLPEDYFPDTYLDIDLTGTAKPALFFLLDSRECCLVNTQTEGRWFAENDVPAVVAPEQFRRAAGMAFTDGERQPLETDVARISLEEILCRDGSPETENPAALRLIERIGALQARCTVCDRSGECTVTFRPGKRSPKNRFSKKDTADQILSILEELGAPGDRLSRLKDLSRNYGIPFYDATLGYREWLCSTDIGYFSVTFRGEEAVRFHVGILLTDKAMDYRGRGIKPSQTYQWHITDHCDQRCKHCYLFAEDALLKCVTTPWDMLMRTLDECTLDAARRHAWPMLAVTGGDPILHPRFWDFAEEIHRRGICWDMMGNPFHLSPEVCVRLKQLGVSKYQMSLDGLEPFHDHMRKPGSFRATLTAIRWLNDAGIDSQLMATASRKNLDDIIACMDIAAEHHAFSFAFARYCATSPEKAEDYPSPEEYHRFLARYYDKSAELRKRGFKTRFVQKEHLFTLLKWERGEFTVPESSRAHPEIVCDGCHLGRTGCILSNGDVVACRRMESVVGNVWKESLADIETSAEMARYADVKNIKGCKDCELLNWCRGCRAVGFNATGDLQAADPCCWKNGDHGA